MMQSLLRHLCEDCEWPAEAIHLFGFAQGGSVVAEAALRSAQLGSIVSVNGPLLSFPTSEKSQTPALLWQRSDVLCHASTAFSKGFDHTTVEVVGTLRGQGMPRSQAEWMPIMRFWTKCLRRLAADDELEVMSRT